MRLIGSLAVVAVIAVGVQAERAKLPPPPATPLRYTDVAPIFEKHCAGCHDARRGTNAAAQAVFEMSGGYPFATKRPGTLLGDLRHMFENRGSLSQNEKWRGVSWIAGGARDAEGRPPVWR
ncbi:MAG TPA: hypothetical protein VIV11_39510 [Kofleriaceae bacterium]